MKLKLRRIFDDKYVLFALVQLNGSSYMTIFLISFFFVRVLNMICTSEILNTLHLIYHHFSTTQYPFSIFYLPTQVQMGIVYQKNGFKREFSTFLMYLFWKKTINTYLKEKNSLHTTQIYSFKYVFIVFFNKNKMQLYI